MRIHYPNLHNVAHFFLENALTALKGTLFFSNNLLIQTRLMKVKALLQYDMNVLFLFETVKFKPNRRVVFFRSA